MRRRVAAAVALALCLGSPTGSRAGFVWSDAKAKEVDVLIAERHIAPPVRTASAADSLSLAVSIDGTLVMTKGYGSAAPGLLAGPATVYHIGSLSKQFTAAAVLSLIDSGTLIPGSHMPLALDTRVHLLFDGAERWEPPGQAPMTLKSLLTMTSNLPNFTRRPPPTSDPWGMMPAPQLLSALKKIAPSGWPGSFEYSNTSYFLVAEAVEAVASAGGDRRSYRDVLRALFARAGMTQTGFAGDYAERSEFAAPHYRRRPAFTQRDWLKGSGDVASNVLDLFAWTKALMEGRILSEKSRELMFAESARVTPTQYYGMGWFIEERDGLDEYSHSGAVPGFTSFNSIVRSKDGRQWMSVTILTNGDGVEGLDVLARDIVHMAR